MANTNLKSILFSQAGRTMTEILGVLAIMGIITMTALWGYRYSLDRIMANEVVNGVRMRSVIIGQQRVLEQDLDLKEFHPDSAEDKIYGRFKVEAFNDYPNDRPSPYGNAVVSNSGLNGEEYIQALEVYDIPYRVCEIVKKTEFPDPTYTAINGELYSWNYGERKYDVECIPDGDVIREGGMISSALDGEYHNVLSFVFHDSVGALCSYDSECHPLCCDNETGVCVRDYGKCHCDVCEERQANGTCKPKEKGVKVVSGADPSQDRCCDGKGGVGLCPPKKCEYNGKTYESGSTIEECGRCTNGNVLMGDWTDEECITCSAATGYKIVNKGQKGCDGVCGSNKTDDGCGCGIAKTAEGCCPGQVKDCAGVCGGTATKDCAGVCNGTAKDEGCGCGIAKTAEGCCPGQVKDCAGVCGGTATKDCAGVCNGTAKDDGCGCGIAKTAEGCCPGQVKDCAGVCGGSAKKDCAGVCNGTATNKTVTNCDGTTRTCCSADASCKDEEGCCPANRTYTEGGVTKCCDNVLSNGHCCASGQSYVGGKCCANGQVVGTTCCDTTKVYTENGTKKCCSGTVYANGTKCCASGKFDCKGVCDGTATNKSVTYKYLDGNCCKSKTETKCLAAGESGPASTCSADKTTTSETNNTCSTVATTTNLCTNVKTTSTTNKTDGTTIGQCGKCVNGSPVRGDQTTPTCQSCNTTTWNWQGHTGAVGACGKCNGQNYPNGAVVVDTSKVGECQTCNTSNWTLSNTVGCCSSGATKLFNERKQNNKTQTFAGCCADGKLLKGDDSTATKFRKKWKEGATGTTDYWSCCGDNQTVIGTASNTSSSCCLTSRVYKDGSTNKCCAKDLSQASDGTKVCCTGNNVNVGGGLCCASGKINVSGHCCNSGQGWADNKCCASNRIYTAGNTKKCCESPNEFINGICRGPATLQTCYASGTSHNDWSKAFCHTTNNTNSNYRIRISGSAVYGHTGYRLNGQIVSGQCESSSLGGTKVELAHRSHKKSAQILYLPNKDAGVLAPGGTFCYYMYTNHGGPSYNLTVTFTRED
ncbi:MAG: hypothetical protein IJV07_05065 [Alphaproteobacteria bacterium]|nr:hypothetical protein [Alphaproteobacteria bacterium]